MGGLRRRLDRLRDKSNYRKMHLVCPACSEEFVIYTDIGLDLEFLVLDWSSTQPEPEYEPWRRTPESVLRAYNHEHDPKNFVYKRSGLPWSREDGV